MDCRIDYPKTASAMTAVVSIVLYFFDLATDIWLAVDYFKDGQTTWGGLTTVCICFPMPVFLILAIYMAFAENGGKKMSAVLTILFFPFLLITTLCGMLLHVCRQRRNIKSKTEDNITCDADENKASEINGDKTTETYNNKTCEADHNKASEIDDNKTSEAYDNKTFETDNRTTCNADDNKTSEADDRAVREAVGKAGREAVDRAVGSIANETEGGETGETDNNKTSEADDSETCETDDKYYRLATMTQVLDALCESFPQLVLQIYILLADESIRSSSGIGTSRIASIVGSILMLSWSLTCYEKMKFYMINEENMPIGGQITVYVLKFCECFLRVLTFGLLASILQPLRPSFIILIIVGIIVAHFALLTLADCLQDCRDLNLKNICHLLYAAIRRVVSYITIYGQPNSAFRIVYYYIIILVESILFAVLWLQFKPDRLAWVSSYAWMIIFPMALLMCALCIYMYYCKRFHNNAAFIGSGKLDIEYCRFLKDQGPYSQTFLN